MGEVPSRWAIVRHDPLARIAGVGVVFGCALCAIYFVDVLRFGPLARVQTWQLVTGLALLPLLPLRLARVRGLFARGREVVGRVKKQRQHKRGAMFTYEYEYDGRRYTNSYSLQVASLPDDASVAVIVDPNQPSRSILKHALIPEAPG